MAEELQQSLAQAEELVQLRTRIIETASHEFRTPLTAINQAAGLLNKYFDRLSEDQRRRNFARITDSVFAIDKLLHNVLAVHQVDRADMMVEQTAVSYAYLCATLRENLLSEFPRSAHTLTFTVAEAAEAEICTDIHLVQQIMSLLIDNAIKFSEPDCPVVVSFALKPTALIVKIADQGVGVPAVEQSMIYDLFVRASNVGARRGLGIGLYLAKRLTEKLNGRLILESFGENQGSVLTLHFPIK